VLYEKSFSTGINLTAKPMVTQCVAYKMVRLPILLIDTCFSHATNVLRS